MKKNLSLFFSVFLLVLTIVGCSKPKAQEYTITFETDGGSTIAPITFTDAKEVEKPTDPTKQDMTFGGWYSDVNLANEFDFADLENKDYTLYADWDVTLTFDSLVNLTALYMSFVFS